MRMKKKSFWLYFVIYPAFIIAAICIVPYILNFTLMEAVKGDSFSGVKTLLSLGANVNTKDEDGATPLMWAAAKGYSDVAKLLIEHGANVNVQEKELGFTPLIISVVRGHANVVKLLIEHGADVNAKDKYGHTPLAIAIASGRRDIVRILENAGAEY